MVGNGDVHRAADIDRLKAATGCQAVMIGRAAVGNPWIFQRVERVEVPKEEVLHVMRLHLNRSLDFYGERGLVLFRKHANRYLNPYPETKAFKKQLMMAASAEEFFQLVEENLTKERK